MTARPRPDAVGTRGTDARLADSPGAWPVVGSTDLHRDDWVVALRRDLIHPPGDDAGEPFGRLVLEHPGAAIVFAVAELDGVEHVCLIRQYRHPAGRTFVELPAGLCDVPGEDPVETAKRELREEASLEAEEWRLLASTYPSPGITAERHHLYLARGLTAVETDYEAHHEEAHIEVFWAPLEELVAAVLDGRVQEGPVAIAALTYATTRG